MKNKKKFMYINMLLDISPHEKMSSWNSDEYPQLKVSWFKGDELSDYDEILEQKNSAYQRSTIFGLILNRMYYNT